MLRNMVCRNFVMPGKIQLINFYFNLCHETDAV